MTSTTEITTDHSRAKADGAHTHAFGQGVVPAGSRAERLTSFDLADIPVPTGREEEWRFSPVARLQPLFAAELGASGVAVAVTAAPEVKVETVGRDDERLGAAGKPGDRTAVTAWNAFAQSTVVTIPAEAVASEVTAVRIEGTSTDATATHVLIHAERFSEAVVVVDHRGNALLNETVEIVVDEGAHLTVVAVQDWADGAVHASSHRALIGRDARLKHVVVTFGGDVVRITPDAAFAGEGAEVEMVGLYFADTDQHQEHRLFVDHGQPRCKSRVTYKGALQGVGAHAVWVGDVLIQHHAEGTDTYELNRNLVLTDGARADSVPNLEIETGEIEGAGHASATGRFDDEQLFYLQSRGIHEADARRLVVRGFFAELIEQIGVPTVQDRLLASIEAELEKSMSVITGVAPADSAE
ncbi:Fe-S cluster assembly protein SufD [Xylanimonas ulmi]|uniref:Iron-regulated ABC transporter permease protein SufD n=1 Tax=Xylanimonas ulmi TaxID=228973 RepID=A0A4Q7M5C2_9MICO|nr:Fe-S cluster assembly protein SufD [Xylanibacterium ulmi]RZS61219.1 iron-regulated ABC transporter permease protein SufD [Xylanibacterium ulmi]